MSQEKEIFLRPTVKQVVFQIKYPNLFYIETKIGELQSKIMTVFPDSALLFTQNFIIANNLVEGDKGKEQVAPQNDEGNKIWQFKSKEGMVLNITSNSLSVISTKHKRYVSEGDEKGFREIISFVVEHFLEIVPLPAINRVGLRYINECPILDKNNACFKEWFNTSFPLDKIEVASTQSARFVATVEKGNNLLTYNEYLAKKNSDKSDVLVVDIDAFTNDVESSKYLETTDILNCLVYKTFRAFAGEKLLEYMRNRGDDE